MKKTFAVILVSAFALSAAGCADGVNTVQSNPKATVGALGGAALGGLAGSAVGKGSGRDVAMVGGALLGAFAGYEIGKSLDRADKAAIAKTTERALDDNVSYSWQNPENGRSGSVTPTGSYTQNGRQCRNFEQTVYIDGRRESVSGTACKQVDGTWRVIA